MNDEVRVKICGLTRPEDVRAAAGFGADMLGFVFARSPRRLSIAEAKVLLEETGGKPVRVGLFMNQPREEVAEVLQEVTLDLLQFHGQEDNEFCSAFGLPFLKAVSMLNPTGENSTAEVAKRFPGAQGILLDSHSADGAGGTGKTFNWSRQVVIDQPLWLAGGLNPGNVAEAIEIFRPYAVDVSSGVESAPGIKSDDLVRSFINNAKTGTS